MRTLSLLLILAVVGVGSGCERSDLPKTPVAKPATSPAMLPALEPAAKVVNWVRTEEFPRTVVAIAEADSRAESAKPWTFQDVDPQVFADGRGGYRVAWMKKDPLRNSIGYEWYELDPAQHIVSGSIAFPSKLTEFDITQAPDWNLQPATAPSPSATRPASTQAAAGGAATGPGATQAKGGREGTAAIPKLIGPTLTAKAQYKKGEKIDIRLAFDSINWGVQEGVEWDAEDQNQHWKYWFVRINGQEKHFVGFVLAPSRDLATTFDIQEGLGTELPPGRYRVEYLARDLPVVLRDEPHTRLVPKEIASNEIEFEIIPAARPDTQSATQRSSR